MSDHIRWVAFVGLILTLAVSHMKHAVTAEALRIMVVTLGHTVGAIDALERRISSIEGSRP